MVLLNAFEFFLRFDALTLVFFFFFFFFFFCCVFFGFLFFFFFFFAGFLGCVVFLFFFSSLVFSRELFSGLYEVTPVFDLPNPFLYPIAAGLI